MVYLAAILVLQMASLAAALQIAEQALAKRVKPAPASTLMMVGLMVAAFAAAAPLLGELLGVSTKPQLAHTLDGRAIVAIGLAGVLLAAGLLGWRLLGMRRTGTAASFGAVGAATLGLASCAYLAFVSIDHLAFYAKRDDSGMLGWATLREIESVGDVQCEAALMAVRAIESPVATWRCPRSVVLGATSSAPFIPWPSYTEGQSSQLAQAFRRIRDSARSITQPAM